MRKNYKTEAIVIRNRDLSEKDRITTFLSPFEGRFDALCKGVKRITSKSIGRFEPFNRVSLFLAVGRNLDIVAQSELLNGFPGIRNSLDRTTTAIYLLDRINSHVEKHEKNPGLYNLLRISLELLDRGVDSQVLARMFDIKFVSIMGYQPRLRECVACEKEGDACYFDYHNGGILCDKCIKNRNGNSGRIISPGTICAMLFLQDSPPEKALQFSGHPVIMSEMKDLMEKFMRYNIPGSHIDNASYEKIMGENYD